MKENRHATAVPADIVEEAEALVRRLHELLAPYLTAGLSPRDRMRLFKMGSRNLYFVDTAFNTAKGHPNLIPGHVSVEEFETDYLGAQRLSSLQRSLGTLMQGVTDMAMIAGSESIQSALMVYAAIKMAAEGNVPGAQTLYESMRDKYPKTGRRRTSKTAEPEAS